MRRMAVNPNRMELIRLRRRLVLARRGHKLLKDKQEELTRQYLALRRAARSMRQTLEPQIEAVYSFFGGARASGTNDKAGSYLNLVRWVSPRTIKETFAAPVDFVYPFMDAE